MGLTKTVYGISVYLYIWRINRMGQIRIGIIVGIIQYGIYPYNTGGGAVSVFRIFRIKNG